MNIKKILSKGLVAAMLLLSSNVHSYTINGNLNIVNGNATLQTTKKLNLNVGGTSYISEPSANAVTITAGGVNNFTVTSTISGFGGDLAISSGQYLYLDGSGGGHDTYIRESAANTMQFATGGAEQLVLNAGGVSVDNDFTIQSGKKLILDSGGNNYWINSATGQNDLYASGVLTIRTKNSGEIILPDVNPPNPNYSNRNGNTKGWAKIEDDATVLASYNVFNVVKTGSGTYQINWSTDFASANYACVATPDNIGFSTVTATCHTGTAGTATVYTQSQLTGLLTDNGFSVIGIGAQ